MAGAIHAADPTELRPHQTGTPFLREWRGDDYGASAINWQVTVAPSGLVYVANNSGVLEFDGARWRTLPMPRGGRAGTLVIDQRGRLWAGGHDEIVVFEPDARGVLRARDLAALLPRDNERIGTITRSLHTPEGVYLLSVGRLYRFREEGASFHVDVWKTDARFSALLFVQGSTYVQNAETLMRVEGTELRPVAAPLAASVHPYTFNQRRPFTARTLADGTHLLLTASGPFRWRGPGTELVPLSAELAALFVLEGAQAAAFMPDGRMAFSMTRSGLLFLGSDGRIQQRLDRAHGFPHNRVQTIAPDGQGGLWLTLHYGLARVQLDSPLFLHGAAHGVEGGSRRVARQWDRIYVANGEGLARRDPASGHFRPVEGLRLGANRLLALDDRLLVTSGGLKEVSRDDRARPWWNGSLYSVLASRRHAGWLICGGPTGLTLFAPAPATDDTGPGWKLVGNVRQLEVDIENVHDTGDGFVWVSSQPGEIFRVDFRTGLRLDAPIEKFGPDRGVAPLPHSENVHLFTFGDDLCASSPEWFLRFDAAAGRFRPETRLPGFGADRGATVVHPTAAGGLWLLAKKDRAELLQVEPSGREWRTTRWPAGPIAHLTVNSLFEDSSERTLWISGQGALVSLNLDWKEADPASPPPVFVRGAQTVGGEVLYGGSGAAVADRRHPAPLPPAWNGLRFEFATPAHAGDFGAKTRTLYRTRLDGFDDTWSPWSDETHRDFTGLPFRAFTFRVQARDLHGRLTPEATFGFAIAPPWWLTRWAFGSYGLGALLGVAGIVALRTRALHRRAQRLEGIVADRTRELQARNLELARLHRLEHDEKIAARLAGEKAQLEALRYQLNPHFLFNTLNSIYGMVYPHSRPAGELVRQLSDFCRTTLTRSDGVWQSLGQELTMLRSYLEIEQARWRERLRVAITSDDTTLAMMVPTFLLLPLVENAIKHGGATSHGILEIRLVTRRLDAATVEIEVANTGVWRSVGHPRPPTSVGIGMENLHTRLARCFPDAHSLSIDAEKGWVVARLRLVEMGNQVVPSAAAV